MVLLPAPAGPSMAMMSLRWEESIIMRTEHCTRSEGELHHGKHGGTQGSRMSAPAPKGASDFEALLASLKRCPDTKPILRQSFCRLLAHPLWAGLGNVGLFRRSYLQQRLAPDMYKAQFARREQGMDCFFHARPRDEVCQEVLDLCLIHGQHAVQIFRDQSRERFGHRNSHTLAHNIRRPARQLVPHRAFFH